MKRLLMITTLLVFLIASCVSNKQMSSSYLTSYKIISIKKRKGIYDIEAIKNDTLFRVLSKENKKKNIKCSEIKKNNYYDLDLEKIFPPDYFSGSTIHNIEGYTFNGVVVKLNRKRHGSSLYISKNLEGLCIGEQNMR